MGKSLIRLPTVVLTGLNSPAVISMLLTVPRRRLSVCLCCFIVVFSSTVSSPLPLVFISLINPPPPSPGLLSPSPLWVYYSIIYLLQVIYHLVITLSVLCLALSCFLFGVRLGFLPLVLVAGSYGGCVH
jgi:hypothetical protein